MICGAGFRLWPLVLASTKPDRLETYATQQAYRPAASAKSVLGVMLSQSLIFPVI